MPEVQAELDLMKIYYLSSDQIISDAKDLYTHWPELPREEKRKIVESITERITVGKDEINIDLCYLPSFLETGTKATPHQGFMAATSWTRAG